MNPQIKSHNADITKRYFVVDGANSIAMNYLDFKENRAQIIRGGEDNPENKMKQLIKELLRLSIQELYRNDYLLIKSHQSERSVCARLAFYLQEALSANSIEDYFVDVEYVRLKEDKEIAKHRNPKGRIGKIYCDLLIHRRCPTSLADNLLEVEMKVGKNTSNKKADIDRLKELVQPRTNETHRNMVCDTLLGVFLQIQEKAYKYSYIERNGNVVQVSSIEKINVLPTSGEIQSAASDKISTHESAKLISRQS